MEIGTNFHSSGQPRSDCWKIGGREGSTAPLPSYRMHFLVSGTGPVAGSRVTGSIASVVPPTEWHPSANPSSYALLAPATVVLLFHDITPPVGRWRARQRV